jgi:acyl-CoA reductase-like NAD-dependent aldehyde dehydrogenase
MSDGIDGRLWIGNAREDAASGRTFDTVNPATGEVITSVAEGAEADIDRAVAAARAALASPEWRGMDAHRRAEILWRLGDLIEAHADELGSMETRDNGKPIFESRQVDLPSVVENFRYFAGLADKIQGETIPVKGSFLNYTLREPVGVVGCIVPWNFPLSLATWKVAPALACGNTVVLKPAEETPLTALRLGELAAEAGLPAGVLNVVRDSVRPPGQPWSGIPVWTRSRSPGPPRLERPSCVRPPTLSKRSRWSWAVSRRTSCSRMPTLPQLSGVPPRASSTERVKCAQPDHECWWSGPSMTIL